MSACRFEVYGRLVLVERDATGWKPYFVGPEGKRRPAEFVVPDDLSEDEIGPYLGDLFHENATPTNGDVRRIA